MKRLCCAVFRRSCALTVVLAVSVWCGLPAALAAEEQVPKETAAASALPEWAPEDPSKEFLRGVEALGSIPREEVLPEGAGAEAEAFLTAMMEILWPRSFELFGSLTDEQAEKFLAEREIRLPIPSLPPSQKAALDTWVKAADEVIAGAPEAIRPADETLAKGGYLALLREVGAAADLSNVDVGFGQRGGVVGVYFWIKPFAGGKGSVINNDFARLKAKEAAPSGE